jgi:CrcB protein
VRETVRLTVLVGILGGLTTFSTFGFEAISLVAHGRPGAAILYVLASNTAGLLAVWLGFRLAAR